MEQITISNKLHDVAKREFEGSAMKEGGLSFEDFCEGLMWGGLNRFQGNVPSEESAVNGSDMKGKINGGK